MGLSDLQTECEAWRLVFGLFPRGIKEWVARINDIVRFTRRNYQGSVGVLLGFDLEPTEFRIGLTESAFDTLAGKRIIEDKILVIPAAAVMYHEFINDTQDFDPSTIEPEIGAMELG